MILEVKTFPESLEVMRNKEWFFICDAGEDLVLGDSAYARVLDDSEYIMVEKTTADEHNKDWLSELLACPTCKVDLANIIKKYPNDMKLGEKIREYAQGEEK